MTPKKKPRLRWKKTEFDEWLEDGALSFAKVRMRSHGAPDYRWCGMIFWPFIVLQSNDRPALKRACKLLVEAMLRGRHG